MENGQLSRTSAIWQKVDEISLRRIDEMMQGISPMSSAVFETKQDYNAMPIRRVLDYFVNNRLKNLKRYNELNEDEAKKSSLHPRLQVMLKPVDLAWFDAEHDDHHLVRIKEIISTAGSNKTFQQHFDSVKTGLSL